MSTPVFASETNNNFISEQEIYIVIDSEENDLGIVYFVKKDTRIQKRSLWDFVDIAMAGASWYDLIKDPSLKKLSWAILDTAAIAPLIPSSRWVRKGAKYVIPIKEIKKLASTSAGKNKLLKALKVTKAISKLDNVAKLAKNYKLTQSQFVNHILKKYSKAIGIDSDGKTPLKTIKVVLNENGYVTTAYPVR